MGCVVIVLKGVPAAATNTAVAAAATDATDAKIEVYVSLHALGRCHGPPVGSIVSLIIGRTKLNSQQEALALRLTFGARRVRVVGQGAEVAWLAEKITARCHHWAKYDADERKAQEEASVSSGQAACRS